METNQTSWKFARNIIFQFLFQTVLKNFHIFSRTSVIVIYENLLNDVSIWKYVFAIDEKKFIRNWSTHAISGCYTRITINTKLRMICCQYKIYIHSMPKKIHSRSHANGEWTCFSKFSSFLFTQVDDKTYERLLIYAYISWIEYFRKCFTNTFLR